MHAFTRQRFVTAFVLATLTAASGLRAQNAQENAADVERLIKALEVHAGSIVGEIGADMTGNTVAFAAKKAQPLARS